MSNRVFICQSGSVFAIARKLREEPPFFAAVLRRSSPVRKTKLLQHSFFRFWGHSPGPALLTVGPWLLKVVGLRRIHPCEICRRHVRSTSHSFSTDLLAPQKSHHLWDNKRKPRATDPAQWIRLLHSHHVYIVPQARTGSQPAPMGAITCRYMSCSRACLELIHNLQYAMR